VNACVDAVTKGDIAGKFVQLAIDGDLPSVAASIRDKREAVAGWHKWIGDYIVPVEEEFQKRDARAADRAVSRRISRMGR